MSKLTDKELDILGHTLGVNVYHARLSKKKKDKMLPQSYYRNHFCAGTEQHSDYEVLKSLEVRGFMQRWINSEQLYFFVSAPGIAAFESQFKKDITGIKTKEEKEEEEKEKFENTVWTVAKELGETYGTIGRSENYHIAKDIVKIVLSQTSKNKPCQK